MKRLLTLLTILISVNSFGQKFIVLPNGIKSDIDSSKDYIVLNIKNGNAEKNYEAVEIAANKSYNSPTTVLSKIPNKTIHIHASDRIYLYNKKNKPAGYMTSIYNIDIDFKDSLIRIHAPDITTWQQYGISGFSGKPNFLTGDYIYDENGNLRLHKTKDVIEDWANGFITMVQKSLTTDW